MKHALTLTLLLGCQTEAEPKVALLSPREQLIRLSVDLRGVHPSEAELVAIEQNPALYDDYVDRYLDDPRFLERIKEIFNLRYLTRNGDAYYDPAEAGLAMSDAMVADSLAEEPLALVAYIVDNDLPFSEMVLADYTMADAVTAKMWNLDRPDDATGWVPASYLDGRPHAGILTMQTIWERYPSMGGNANRHRANAVSRLLLCDDYLSRPIVLNRAAVDQLTIDPEDAIASETCQSCHSTLDPLAAHFFGFFHEDEGGDLRQATTYRPEAEEGWRASAGKEPAYYGTPTSDLNELAFAIAEDPRFRDCAVQTVMEGLTQRTVTDDDWNEFQFYATRFDASGMNVKALVRDLVSTDLYKAASTPDAALDERLTTVKTASPAQLASIIEDLTGYRWTFSGRDGLTTQDIGLPVLAGGVDGAYVSLPAYEPGVGMAFVHERLSQAAAQHVVAHDLDPARTEDAILLGYVTALDTPESNPEAFQGQIRALYRRITGVPLPEIAPEPAELMVLWKEIYAVEGTAEAAWAGVVSAVLRDPSVLFY